MNAPPVRILRVYHSGVVDEYRARDRLLRDVHGFDSQLMIPPSWVEGGSRVEPGPESDVPLHVVNVRGRGHPNLFWYSSRAFRRVLRTFRPAVVDFHEEPYSLAV